jgi:hypothetical protein
MIDSPGYVGQQFEADTRILTQLADSAEASPSGDEDAVAPSLDAVIDAENLQDRSGRIENGCLRAMRGQRQQRRETHADDSYHGNDRPPEGDQ